MYNFRSNFLDLENDVIWVFCEKVFPKAGEELVYRLTLMVVLGPIYGWYVIAKTAMNLTPRPKDSPPKHSSVKYLSWKKT